MNDELRRRCSRDGRKERRKSGGRGGRRGGKHACMRVMVEMMVASTDESMETMKRKRVGEDLCPRGEGIRVPQMAVGTRFDGLDE